MEGVLDFDDLANLVDEISEEIDIDDAEDSAFEGDGERSGYCTTSGDTITCTNSSADKAWIWVGKKASSNYVQMCGSTTAAGTYSVLGYAEVTGATTRLRVEGSSNFAEAIKIARTAGSVTGCSFDAFPSAWFTDLRQIHGNGYYDYIYGSDGDDALQGEYVMGYAGEDTISIESNQVGTEYGFGGDDDDTLIGNAGTDDLYGQDGDDTIEGNGGGDYLRGGPGNDELEGGDGDDRMYGDGPDPCDDYADQDTLLGGLGNDTLYSQCGDDLLDGEGGASDVCDGGSNVGSGLYIGDGCKYSTCESYTNCEYNWI